METKELLARCDALERRILGAILTERVSEEKEVLLAMIAFIREHCNER